MASPDPSQLPRLEIVRHEGAVVGLTDAAFLHGEQTPVQLRNVRELFRGNAKPGDLSQGPTPELMPLFMVLERTVVEFCDADGRDATDQDLEALYGELRRRPDKHTGRLQSYLRAAVCVYMSRVSVSQAEYEAVMTRLARSARTMAEPPISRNYVWAVRKYLPAAT